MIKAVFGKNLSGSIRRLSIKGHSGYAEEGQDIICSAVSAIAYTTAGALGELAGIEDCYREASGYMVISIPENLTAEQEATAGIILRTAEIGLKQIELSYGKYVVVVNEEV